MELLITYDSSSRNYAAWEADAEKGGEPLGIGKSPDEAVGMAVRAAWLMLGGSVTVDAITHTENDTALPPSEKADSGEWARQLRKINRDSDAVIGLVPDITYTPDGTRLDLWHVVNCTLAYDENDILAEADTPAAAVAAVYRKLYQLQQDGPSQPAASEQSITAEDLTCDEKQTYLQKIEKQWKKLQSVTDAYGNLYTLACRSETTFPQVVAVAGKLMCDAISSQELLCLLRQSYGDQSPPSTTPQQSTATQSSERTCAICGVGYVDTDLPMSVYPVCGACKPSLN